MIETVWGMLQSEDEPSETPQQLQVTHKPKPTTSQVPPQIVEPEKDRFHRSLIRHNKSLMEKMHTVHLDLCVATKAYNDSQARQASYKAAMLNLHQKHLKVQQQKVALLKNQNSLVESMTHAQKEMNTNLLSVVQTSRVMPTRSTTRNSGDSSATTSAAPSRQLCKKNKCTCFLLSFQFLSHLCFFIFYGENVVLSNNINTH
ncbi:hypothetical protein XENTR_v10015034 [Xenopus tropicalis]|nr:hypothetical protein XENTR_v10015034 [Xenopus tropicalis]